MLLHFLCAFLSWALLSPNTKGATACQDRDGQNKHQVLNKTYNSKPIHHFTQFIFYFFGNECAFLGSISDHTSAALRPNGSSFLPSPPVPSGQAQGNWLPPLCQCPVNSVIVLLCVLPRNVPELDHLTEVWVCSVFFHFLCAVCKANTFLNESQEHSVPRS